MSNFTTFGFGSSSIVPQPGFNATRNANNGWEGTHSFKVLRTYWNSILNRSQFDKNTSIATLDDSLTSFSFMLIDKLQVTNETCEWVDVKTILTGSSSATYGENEEANQPTYVLNGGLQEAPLSEHPKWKALDSDSTLVLGKLITGEATSGPFYVYAGAPNARTGIWETIKDSAAETIMLEDDALEFAELIGSGQTTYLRPTLTWTENAEGLEAIPSNQLAALGNIVSVKGNPPLPSGGRDWMLTSATDYEAAGTHRTTLEWTLSERGGHNEFLYAL